MNTVLKNIFSEMRKDINKFKSATVSADMEYRDAVEKAKGEAALFKDEESFLEERRKAAKSVHEQTLYAVESVFVNGMKKNHFSSLREELTRYVSAAPKTGFLEALNTYRQFDLPITKSELAALVVATEGNFLALRALSAQAQKSGWKLTVPDAESLERDLETIENRFTRRPVLWHDIVLHGTACETRDTSTAATPAEAQRAWKAYGLQGTVPNRMNSAELLAANASFENAEKILDRMAELWTATFVPEIERLEPLTETDKNGNEAEISVDEQHEKNISDAAKATGIEDHRGAKWAEKIISKKASAERAATENRKELGL